MPRTFALGFLMVMAGCDGAAGQPSADARSTGLPDGARTTEAPAPRSSDAVQTSPAPCTAQGCACSPASPPLDCYDGPAPTRGVGECRAGKRTCQAKSGGEFGGVWGACVGEVLPAAPQCDGRDHDCNGAADTCTKPADAGAAGSYCGYPPNLFGPGGNFLPPRTCGALMEHYQGAGGCVVRPTYDYSGAKSQGLSMAKCKSYCELSGAEACTYVSTSPSTCTPVVGFYGSGTHPTLTPGPAGIYTSLCN